MFATMSNGDSITIYDSNRRFIKTYSFNAIRFNKKKILRFIKKETNATLAEMDSLYEFLTSFVTEETTNV